MTRKAKTTTPRRKRKHARTRSSARPEDLYPSLRMHPTPAERRAAILKRLKARGVKPLDEATLDAMSEVWPEDENLDDFLAWLRETRHRG